MDFDQCLKKHFSMAVKEIEMTHSFTAKLVEAETGNSLEEITLRDLKNYDGSYELADVYLGALAMHVKLGNISGFDLNELLEELHWPGDFEHDVLYELKKSNTNAELAEHYLELGVESKRVGQYSKAIHFYKKAEELNPQNDMIYYSMAKTYYILENYNEAFSNYIKCLAARNFKYNDSFLLHLGHAICDKDNESYFRKMYLCSIDPFNSEKYKSYITNKMWTQNISYDHFCVDEASKDVKNLIAKWKSKY